jgi:hypothetical protein
MHQTVLGERFSADVIVLHETHLRRLAGDYLGYYHADSTHDGLDKGTPQGDRHRSRILESNSHRILVHHRYFWAKAA